MQLRESISHVIFNPNGIPVTGLFSDHSQSCDTNVIHVDIPSGLARIFILHENDYTTRVVNISTGGLGTISTRLP